MSLENVCIYLRKSRADREAEARGEGETLARHERILLDLARSRNYNVGAIYRENCFRRNYLCPTGYAAAPSRSRSWFVGWCPGCRGRTSGQRRHN